VRDLKKINTKEEAIKIVKERGVLIKYLQKWQDDKDVVIAAVSSFPFALEFVSLRLKGDKDVVLTAVKKEPRTLSLAAKEVYNNDKIREFAFSVNKGAFIVDPDALEEFAYQDGMMMKQIYRSHVIIDANGKRSWDKTNYHQALSKNTFYKMFKKVYQADLYKLTSLDVKKYEQELLNMKYSRITSKDKSNTECDALGF